MHKEKGFKFCLDITKQWSPPLGSGLPWVLKCLTTGQSILLTTNLKRLLKMHPKNNLKLSRDSHHPRCIKGKKKNYLWASKHNLINNLIHLLTINPVIQLWIWYLNQISTSLKSIIVSKYYNGWYSSPRISAQISSPNVIFDIQVWYPGFLDIRPTLVRTAGSCHGWPKIKVCFSKLKLGLKLHLILEAKPESEFLKKIVFMRKMVWNQGLTPNQHLTAGFD
jgi:hypothetical protein